MLETGFFRACEAAAERFGVPSLALAWSGPAGEGTFCIGCDPATRFRIASITKPMTAALALQLLDPEAPTGIWPEDVRVRHLLSHLSGYACELGDVARFGSDDGALERLAEGLSEARRIVGADDIWSYANTGYWLAGVLAARAAGSTFEEALTARVLDPAGLTRTDFGAPDVAGSGRGATDAPYPRARRPSGGVVSTVSDLVAFAEWLLRSPSHRLMCIPRGRPVGGVYGFGLFGERVAGRDVWGHSGSYGGFQSSLLFVPADGSAFAGLTSSGHGKAALHLIEDLWLEDAVGARRARPVPVELGGAELAAFAGRYANDETTTEVTVAGDGLEVEVFDVVNDERLLHRTRPIGPRTFAIVGGEFDGDRIDFPRAGFARFGSRLSVLVA